MASETSTARALARRLVARDAMVHGTGSAPADVVAACERVYRDLERWLGPVGCDALFTRAIARSRASHPALNGIRLRERAPGFDHVADSIDAYGVPAVSAALEDALVGLLALLGRMVGDDMVERLVDPTDAKLARTDPGAVPDPGALRAAPADAGSP